MDSRVDELLSKLSHPLPAVRQRSLQNLASKIASGIMPVSRIASNVQATRALASILASAESLEIRDALKIIQMVASKDAWSAAVLVDAGMLDLMQTLIKTNSEEKTTTTRISKDLHVDPKANFLDGEDAALVRKLIKVLVSVPTEQANALSMTLPANAENASSSGKKIGSPGRASSKHPDHSMESRSSAKDFADRAKRQSDEINKAAVRGGRGGWCFPRRILTRADEEVLFRARAELSSGDIVRQLGMARQFGTLLFRDYPAEVFLQRPECFRMLLSLLRHTKEQMAQEKPDERSRQLFVSTVDALETFMAALRASLKMQLDCELKPAANVATPGLNALDYYVSGGATEASAAYPSYHNGSVTRAASPESVTQIISMGDAALMVAVSALPRGDSSKEHIYRLLPLFKSAVRMLSEPFPIYHALLTGRIFDHQSLTASRFGRLLEEASAIQYSPKWSESNNPECFACFVEVMFAGLFRNQENDAETEVPAYTQIHLIPHVGEGQTQSAEQSSDTNHGIRVPEAVSQFVRRVLFRNCFSEDGPESLQYKQRRSVLLSLLEQVDRNGHSLLSHAVRVADSVKSTLAVFSKKNDSVAFMGGESESNISNFIELCSHLKEYSSEQMCDLMENRMDLLETAVTSLLSVEDKMSNLNEASQILPPDVVTEVCGQAVISCCILSEYASASCTSTRENSLLKRCFRILARLLAFPISMVQHSSLEILHTALVSSKLKGIGFQCMDLSSDYVKKWLLKGVILDSKVLAIILIHGASSKVPEIQALANGIIHQIRMLSQEEYVSLQAVQSFIPLIDSVPVVRYDAQVRINTKALCASLDDRTRILLELQHLVSKDQAVRIEAARYLRAQANIDVVGSALRSSILNAVKIHEVEIEADPRMLRDPILYTMQDLSGISHEHLVVSESIGFVDLSFAGVAHLDGSFAHSASRDDVQRLGNILKQAPRRELMEISVDDRQSLTVRNEGIEFSIWCAAAIHLTSIIVHGGAELAERCGAHSKNKDNTFSIILEQVLSSGALQRGNSWEIRAVALELCLVLVGSCAVCWTKCSEVDYLMSVVIPSVFHAEPSVRLRAVRLALILSLHPCRIAETLYSENRLDIKNFSMLVNASGVSSIPQNDDMLRSTPTSVRPVIFLPSVVINSCNAQMLSSLVKLVQYSFSEVHISKPGEAEAMIISAEQKHDLLTHLHSLASHANSRSVPIYVASVLSKISKSQNHEEFASLVNNLFCSCRCNPMLQHAVLMEKIDKSELSWWSVFRRFLLNAPISSQDDRTLCSVIRLLRCLLCCKDNNGQLVTMETGGIVTLITVLKKNLFDIIKSSQISLTSFIRQQSKYHDPNSKKLLATGIDYYASPSSMAQYDCQGRFACENARVDVVVALFQLLEELHSCSMAISSPIVLDAIQSIVSDTDILSLIATVYISNVNMRLDARYFAAKAALAMTLPILEAQISTKVNDTSIEGMCNLFAAYLDVLNEADFKNFYGKTLTRCAITYIAAICSNPNAMPWISNILSESVASSFDWCTYAMNDCETVISATAHEIACFVSILKTAKEGDVKGQVSESLEKYDYLPTGVVTCFETAMKSSKAALVRASALDAITNSLECLNYLSASDFGVMPREQIGIRMADWLSNQLKVTSDFLVEAAATSPRILLALGRLVSYLVLGMRDSNHSTPLAIKQLELDCRYLWEKVLTNGSSDISLSWEATISPLLSHAYVPDELVVDARSLNPPADVTAFVNDRTTSFAVAASAAIQVEGGGAQYGRTSFSELAIKLVHELWSECHVPIVHQARGITMFLVHTFSQKKPNLIQEENKVSQDKEESFVTKAGHAALETLQASWRVMDLAQSGGLHISKHSNLHHQASLMVEMATSLIAGATFMWGDSVGTLPNWLDSSLLLCLAAKGTVYFEDLKSTRYVDVSEKSCYLLWCILENPYLCPFRAVKSLEQSSYENGEMKSGGVEISLVSHLTCTLVSKYSNIFNRESYSIESIKNPLSLSVLQSLVRLYPVAQKCICDSGCVHFALDGLTKVHDAFMRIGVDREVSSLRTRVLFSGSNDPLYNHQSDSNVSIQRDIRNHYVAALRVHFRFLESILRVSSVAREQALKLNASQTFNSMWSLIQSIHHPTIGSGSILCAYLRMLAAMVNTTKIENMQCSRKLNREVFGIPEKGVQMFAVGRESNIVPFSRTDGAPLSLLGKLVQLITKRLAKAVPTSTPAVVSSSVPLPPAAHNDDDLTVVQLGSFIVSQLAHQDLQASRVLSRTPIIRNLITILDCSVDTLPKPLSDRVVRKLLATQAEIKSQTIKLLQTRHLAFRQCMLQIMLAISTHKSEQACFFSLSKNTRRCASHNFLNLAARVLSENQTGFSFLQESQSQVGMMIYVLRNLALRPENRPCFLVNSDVLPHLIHIFSSKEMVTSYPNIIAMTAICLWALVFNNKRIVPALKQARVGHICDQTGKLLREYFQAEQQNFDNDFINRTLISHALTILPKLKAWL